MTTEILEQPVLASDRRPEVLVGELDAARSDAWDEYVLSHPFGSPFHLNAWRKSIEETFRYKPVYLMATRAGQICGVLPLFIVKTPLLGKVLLSTPFAVYGGALTDDTETQEALRNEVVKLAHRLKVQYVELRNAHEDQVMGFERVCRYVTFTQDVCANEDKVLESIPRKTRYMVRKSLKQGFATRVAENPNAFEDLYAKNLRKLGTPSFPSKFFRCLRENFAGEVDIREVILDGKLASSVLTFYFRDQALPYYGASDPEFNAVAPNNFMYYDLMRWSGANGYRTFDFGRSKKNVGGSYEFKSHWGMVERELPYEMLLVKRKQLPNFTPANPAFSLPLKIWRNLPLSVTRAIGPFFLRMIP
ncbi:MAG: FemAB family PEP-CTERM system-associated protein [Acidobacteriaceae bacterium]|nr:FemAB family PEP-CTERM system-associated protein [Acidobacteriaceae bacterium]